MFEGFNSSVGMELYIIGTAYLKYLYFSTLIYEGIPLYYIIISPFNLKITPSL